jgi:hypothetical protein
MDEIVMEFVKKFDKSLTREERDAPTFLEWSDATLARGVRVLAADLHDNIGFEGIVGVAAAMVLEKIAREANRSELRLYVGRDVTVTIGEENRDESAQPR